MSGATSAGSTGTGADMVSRMRTVLPPSWFPLTGPGAAASATPVLDGILSGIGSSWAYCFTLLQFVILQARVVSASGSFLDLIGADFFGVAITRRPGETDYAFRSRIQANLLLPRATRSALATTIDTLLGQSPAVFEPFRGADAGGYGGGSTSGAGGGGGYGSPQLLHGSSMMPFQYLLTVVSGNIPSRRESDATFIGADGQMSIAGRHVARALYVGGVSTGYLVEARGFNLIKDSVNWSGWPSSSSTGTCRWTVDATGSGALLAGFPVMEVDIYSGGAIVGPSVAALAPATPITASFWLMLPAGHTLQSCGIEVSDQSGNSAQGAIDVALIGIWQRASATLPAGTGTGRLVSCGFVGQSGGVMTGPLLTQCWQIEPGATTTSYIPSSYQIGIREADDLVTVSNAAAPSVDQAALNEAVLRVTPAGSIAWTVVLQ